MREQIMQWGKQKNLKGISDVEIYDMICDNFYIEDFAEARSCSIELFKLFNYQGRRVEQP